MLVPVSILYGIGKKFSRIKNQQSLFYLLVYMVLTINNAVTHHTFATLAEA